MQNRNDFVIIENGYGDDVLYSTMVDKFKTGVIAVLNL